MPASLLERRLHVVVGKGGVGKTTVAAALALLLARRGRRTLAIEIDPEGPLARLLGRETPGYAPAPVAPGLEVLAVDGRAALEEYLGMIIPVRRLLATVFSSTVYQYFVAVAPGLKELMTVGKIWYEAVRREHGRPVWDAIVVDAAASGHSLQHLRMPQAARETFGAGLVQREAARIAELLRDPRTTAVHLVTLAEEMPVIETLETRAQLAGALGFPLGWVVVNRLHRRRFAPAPIARLRAAASSGPEGARALLASVADRAAEESGWTELNATYLARLRAELPETPLLELPFLFTEEFARREVERLSGMLETGLQARVRAAARRPS
jgi:anion-transporting  ArsA/GET3 family ATPase